VARCRRFPRRERHRNLPGWGRQEGNQEARKVAPPTGRLRRKKGPATHVLCRGAAGRHSLPDSPSRPGGTMPASLRHASPVSSRIQRPRKLKLTVTRCANLGEDDPAARPPAQCAWRRLRRRQMQLALLLAAVPLPVAVAVELARWMWPPEPTPTPATSTPTRLPPGRRPGIRDPDRRGWLEPEYEAVRRRDAPDGRSLSAGPFLAARLEAGGGLQRLSNRGHRARIRVTLDGILVTDYTDDGSRPPEGHVGVQNHAGRVEFSNIMIRSWPD
jgi:hypothetical protein